MMKSWVFIITGGFTNPYLTSDGGLPRRVHFCVPAHKNSNNKSVCLGRGFGLGKLVFRRVRSGAVVWLSSVCGVCVCVCVCVCLCVCVL